MRESSSKYCLHAFKLIEVSRLAILLIVVCLSGNAAAASESLLIGPGDLLHIQVVDTPEMDQSPRVTDSGQIPIEGAGNVKVAGLTPAEASTAIQNRLIEAGYMRHPSVQVTVVQYATQSVSVLGEVRSPGAYPTGTPRSILDVLALAGGLNSIADRNIVIERHGDPSSPTHYRVTNDAERAIVEQVMVSPGDTVIVPKAGIIYVLGDVNRPGGYVMANNESTMTMLQVLALAGGVSKTAKEGQARLIRAESSGAHSEKQLSVADLQKGKIPDIAMQPGDVLYIPFSYVKNLAVFGSAGIAASATSAALYAVP
jgi:polysaccharide export outer membrane protein